jgi:hypothetical protein
MSANGSAGAANVASGVQYALPPSPPVPVSPASKNVLVNSSHRTYWSLLPLSAYTCGEAGWPPARRRGICYPTRVTRGQRRSEERPAMGHIRIDVHKRDGQIYILAESGEVIAAG